MNRFHTIPYSMVLALPEPAWAILSSACGQRGRDMTGAGTVIDYTCDRASPHGCYRFALSKQGARSNDRSSPAATLHVLPKPSEKGSLMQRKLRAAGIAVGLAGAIPTGSSAQEYDPHAIVKSVIDVVVPGSFLVVSHARG
jgi:hypothetical protein